MDSLTVYIYKAETCTNILRNNTCMSSYPEDREVDENRAIKVVQPAILTYPTMVFFTSGLVHRSYGMIYGV